MVQFGREFSGFGSASDEVASQGYILWVKIGFKPLPLSMADGASHNFDSWHLAEKEIYIFHKCH